MIINGCRGKPRGLFPLHETVCLLFVKSKYNFERQIQVYRIVDYERYRGEKCMKFSVVLEPAEEGGFNVTVPALDGCFTQGETEEEALQNAREAILCYLEGLEKVNEIKAKPGALAREIDVAL
jgi:antitoxin HicB